jgi:aminoglycoside 6'-N-acetyltransferase
MRLRSASAADLALLRYWEAKPHVIAARGKDGSFVWESELPRRLDWRELLIAESDGRSIGFIQIIDPAREETHYGGADDCLIYRLERQAWRVAKS